jgi:O-acetyl-ADP-ribose deacetylase (regulator of RNase III)
MAHLDLGGRRLEVVGGSITKIPAEAIVNAANERLIPGGGVDGAIHQAGGPAILADLRARYGDTRRCPTGHAVVTVAGALSARWVIHAVGPEWEDGLQGERELLASAYRASLGHADALGVRSIAFPAISCGVFGYPLPEGARVALETVHAHLSDGHPTTIERATFVLLSSDVLRTFEVELDRLPSN